MTLVEATDALADLLAVENAALEALDLCAPGRLLGAKQAALAAFTAAQKTAVGSPDMRRAATRLTQEADANKRLLQRSMAVQTSVLGILAGAAQRTQAAPRYGRHGAITAPPRTAWALSSSA